MPRQALLLDSADRHAVDNERGGGIVVVRRNAENLHLNIACRASHSVRARRSSIQNVPAARHAWPAKANGGNKTKY